MSSRVCLIIYDLPVYISSCLFSLMLSGLLVIPGVSCLWVLPCPVLSCPVLSCPVLSCPVLSCPVLSCPVLSCPVLSCPVLSCPVLSCHVLPWCVIKYYHLSLYPRLRVPVPPSCVHRDTHVIWKYFSFNFIPILKNIPTFPEFGFYNDDWEMNFKKSS